LLLTGHFNQYYNPADVVNLMFKKIFGPKDVSHERLRNLTKDIVCSKGPITVSGIEIELRKRKILFEPKDLDKAIGELLEPCVIMCSGSGLYFTGSSMF
jgi:hypothetical protein